MTGFASLKRTAYRVIRFMLSRLLGGRRLLGALQAHRSKAAYAHTIEDDSSYDEMWRLPAIPRYRRRALLEVLEGLFASSDIEVRIGITESHAYIAISEIDISLLCETLREYVRASAPGPLMAWVYRGGSYDHMRAVEQLTLDDLHACDSIVVGVPFRRGRFRIGREGGVELLLLQQRDSRLLPRRRRARPIDWTAKFAREPGRDGPQREILATHLLADQPIDVVYTWVDSSDPDWQAARASWAEKERASLASADNDERYLDRDELRYSLRSLWLYAPFVRRIFIVTAGHCPPWLRSENDKISVVRHEDIFPTRAALPTFNSHAIETCLHRISGLSENFIYFNDDVFLGRETAIEDFFTRGGLIKSRLSPIALTASSRPGKGAIPTDWASYNVTRLLRRDFGLFFERKLAHVPMPLKRSLLYEIESRYAQDIESTRAARFRSASDIALTSMLAHFYGIATGRAVECEVDERDYAYADTGRSNFEARLEGIARNEPMFVCLNVTRHVDIGLDRQEELLRRYLEERYPVPSPFEWGE